MTNYCLPYFVHTDTSLVLLLFRTTLRVQTCLYAWPSSEMTGARINSQEAPKFFFCAWCSLRLEGQV